MKQQIRQSTPQEEGVFQASQWIKCPLLCEAEEMRHLIESLAEFSIHPLSGFSLPDTSYISQETFLTTYGEWIQHLKEGIVPSDRQLRSLLACAWTKDPTALWLQPVSQGRCLMKVSAPVVQVQSYFFSYSKDSASFHSLSMGPESVFWGLQFSYPQLYQDPQTSEIHSTQKTRNAGLFRGIRRWIREHTLPTPFQVGEKKIYVPMRISPKCLSWIGSHPQLIRQGLVIAKGTGDAS